MKLPSPRSSILLLSLSVLTLPVSSFAAGKTKIPMEYSVKSGDSLWALARKWDVSVGEVQQAYQLGESTALRAGQKLRQVSSSEKTTSKAKAGEREAKALAPETAKAPDMASVPAEVKVAESKNDAAQPAEPKAEVAQPNSAPLRLPSAVNAGLGLVASVSNPISTVATALQQQSEAVAKANKSETITHRELPALGGTSDESLSELMQWQSSYESVPDWVLQAPSKESQKNATRGNPCHSDLPKTTAWGEYTEVMPGVGMLAQEKLPSVVNLWIHFHGREGIKREWMRAVKDPSMVLISVDAGIDAGSYEQFFADPSSLRKLIMDAEQILSEKARGEVQIAQIGMSAWGAGSAAITQSLKTAENRERVDAVVVLDGLHAPYGEQGLEISRLKPYVKFADAANSGRKLFVLTHSSVPSQGRASTTETAHYLAYKTSSPVHGQSPRQSDPYGLQLYESVDSGSFIMRGYRGGDIPAHCAQLTLMNQVLGEQIQSRWLKTSPATPSVSAASSEKSTATDAKNTAKSGSSQKNSSASATAKSRK